MVIINNDTDKVEQAVINPLRKAAQSPDTSSQKPVVDETVSDEEILSTAASIMLEYEQDFKNLADR